MANNTLASLEAALDRAVAVAVDAQAARDEARARAGLPKSPPAFYTTAQMIGELCNADDRNRAETREIVAAVIADCRYKYDASYVPDAQHRALLELFGEAPKSNIVPLARAIEAAARKRRGEP